MHNLTELEAEWDPNLISSKEKNMPPPEITP